MSQWQDCVTSVRNLLDIMKDHGRFDLDQHCRIYQRSHLHHCRGRLDVSKKFTVRSAYFLPLGNVSREDARPHNVCESGTSRIQSFFNLRNNVPGLFIRIIRTDRFPVSSSAVVPATSITFPIFTARE